MKLLLALALLLTLVTPPCVSQTAPAASKTVYQSSALTVTQVAPNVFVHTSFLATDTYGKVPCNGMIVRSGQQTVIFDTPANNPESEELINWISNELHCQIKAVVPTHFHDDCVGGLPAFARHRIPSYANAQTIAYARQRQANVPQHGFRNRRTLKVGRAKVYATFFGEGHTRDNIVGYFPDEQVLFGGCLVKELNATKGNLADANVQAWPATVQQVKQAYPQVQVVIPGHGQVGDQSLLDYTIRLFQQP
ncbi:subclass B1 metallo-beta-lactamase [Hymenobacter sp. CRA2]|uniref:subclass B1 metallo-beta-lactamase n=1 Tax=Hymenobacter sp. CRA2 TaxID=1955620 RepID=UPI00098F61E1|nr:subclass B1 metallo-beta-lactamase [Hymenobacter sp. CRA2]OON69769.1 subclass B1 metallo-beta-lactamase [Hymenobacter sp. CRA2]